MPKETIHSHLNYSEPRTSDDPTPHAGLGVRVGWSKGTDLAHHPDAGHVELSTVIVYDSREDRDGSPVIPLNRYAINDLIRLLRKARDGAFGTDA